MKKHKSIFGVLIAVGLFFASSLSAAEVRGGARLVILRGADLGNFRFVNVALDGKALATIGFGHNYETTLPPGRHELAVTTTPHPRTFRVPAVLALDVKPGETYRFTVRVIGDRVVLK